MSYAIVRTGGKQYKVEQGCKIDVERIDAEEGAETTLGEVLFVSESGALKIGDPVIEGASVTAKVVAQHRAKKVTAFKYKRRKGFHKTKGHRRALTRLEITSINA
ncbi:MAG: 50S ribosomal protein L21 [Verrucomicrobiales bacterium]